MEDINKQVGMPFNTPEGNNLKLIRVISSEFYNPIGTTPRQTEVRIFHPKYKTIDSFFFLTGVPGIIHNSIQTNERAMELLEIYMKLIPKEEVTPAVLMSEVYVNYFFKVMGYSLSSEE